MFSDRKVSISPFEISVSLGATLRLWKCKQVVSLVTCAP